MSSEKHADPAEIPASLTDTYDIGETLGTGHFSKVKLGINKSTKEKVAIKIIKTPTGNKISMLKAEVRAPPPPRPRARFFLSAANRINGGIDFIVGNGRQFNNGRPIEFLR